MNASSPARRVRPADPRPTECRPSGTGTGVYLYWIPLGAGAHVVRVSGTIYEALSALVQRRPRCDLYHSALIVVVGGRRFVIEMTPIPDQDGPRSRGVVAEGPVGLRWAGCLRVFRYEIRRWPDGVIPDLQFAVSSPVRITDDEREAQLVLDLVPSVPTFVWGRDEVHAGEMWSCNSVVSWLLTKTGLLHAAGDPPEGGRAPGWDAGIVVEGGAGHHVEEVPGRR